MVMHITPHTIIYPLLHSFNFLIFAHIDSHIQTLQLSFTVTWATLVAALADFLSCAIALLTSDRRPLAHPDTPLPPAVARLGAAAPRTPRIPLAVSYKGG